MTLTASIFLFILLLIFRPLRNSFYLSHICIVIGVAYYIETHIMHMTPFSQKAAFSTLITHFITINIVTFLAYFADKKAAKKHLWRIPEKTLHTFALIGGTLAALLAQNKLRHKTKKNDFRTGTWLILALQILTLLVLYLY